MADITPNIPEGRQLIHGYGAGGFRIAGTRHDGSVIVLPNRVLAWSVARYEDFAFDRLDDVVAAAAEIEVLLVGCGARMGMPDAAVRDALKPHGIVPEFMDTGAACRTFNVLLSEERWVAAALIAVE